MSFPKPRRPARDRTDVVADEAGAAVTVAQARVNSDPVNRRAATSMRPQNNGPLLGKPDIEPTKPNDLCRRNGDRGTCVAVRAKPGIP